jgi:predicted ATPase/DNA-binding winged helix-turn-helix (wHTH) protein
MPLSGRYGERMIFAFGPFRLLTAERRLERQGTPVKIGARAIAILIALVLRAGEVVTKNQLMNEVWPDQIVDDSTVRVHISALRKLLGDGEDGTHYVLNVSGRGYSFVAPVTLLQPSAEPESLGVTVARRKKNRPSLPAAAKMIGRDDDVDAVCALLVNHQLVTIFGPGGIGKTTLAVAAGYRLQESFNGNVLFLSVSIIDDPAIVTSELAQMLGVIPRRVDMLSAIIAYLRDKRMLLILDGCERLIEAVAALTSRVLTRAAGVAVLATSREVLGLASEQTFTLLPLPCPTDHRGLKAQNAITYPAVQLFVQRAEAGWNGFVFDDTAAPIVARICRRVDGIPLAIELVAARVYVHGLAETEKLLESRAQLYWRGRRTAPKRHQTLAAMIDWTYSLLSEPKQVLFRRLGVFSGSFGLQAIHPIVEGEMSQDSELEEHFSALISKSLVLRDLSRPSTRFQLLDTTRAYALEKLIEHSELGEMQARHASFYGNLFGASIDADDGEFEEVQQEKFCDEVNQIRSALEWAFSESGNKSLGIILAAASARRFMKLFLINECHTWARRALNCFDENVHSAHANMRLQSAFAMSSLQLQGNLVDLQPAMLKALEVAEGQANLWEQLWLLGGLHVFQMQQSNVHGALQFAKQAGEIAEKLAVPLATSLAEWILGACLHIIGQFRESDRYFIHAKEIPPPIFFSMSAGFGFDFRVPALCGHARNLLYEAKTALAASAAQQTIAEIDGMGDPLSLAFSLTWLTPIFLWTGAWSQAEAMIERLVSLSEEFVLLPYRAAAEALKGELYFRSGEVEAGVERLLAWSQGLAQNRFPIHDIGALTTLAEALIPIGRINDALTKIRQAEAMAESSGCFFHWPEILRVRAQILEMGRKDDHSQVKAAFYESISAARNQGAEFWEIRTSISLAAFEFRQSGPAAARENLALGLNKYDKELEIFNFLQETRIARDVWQPNGD